MHRGGEGEAAFSGQADCRQSHAGRLPPPHGMHQQAHPKWAAKPPPSQLRACPHYKCTIAWSSSVALRVHSRPKWSGCRQYRLARRMPSLLLSPIACSRGSRGTRWLAEIACSTQRSSERARRGKGRQKSRARQQATGVPAASKPPGMLHPNASRLATLSRSTAQCPPAAPRCAQSAPGRPAGRAPVPGGATQTSKSGWGRHSMGSGAAWAIMQHP